MWLEDVIASSSSTFQKDHLQNTHVTMALLGTSSLFPSQLSFQSTIASLYGAGTTSIVVPDVRFSGPGTFLMSPG